MTDTDFIIPSENDKSAVLNQIDMLHEEHRLKVLRDLAIEYNNHDHDHPIDLDKYGSSAFDLIISLWMRDIKVPLGLGLDDPHDKTFFSYTNRHSRDYLIEHSRVVMLVRNSPFVRFYLISGVDMTDSGNVRLINDCIRQLRKKDGSQWENVSNRAQLREFLLDRESLSDLDVAFLAIEFGKLHVYYENFDICDVYFLIEGPGY